MVWSLLSGSIGAVTGTVLSSVTTGIDSFTTAVIDNTIDTNLVIAIIHAEPVRLRAHALAPVIFQRIWRRYVLPMMALIVALILTLYCMYRYGFVDWVGGLLLILLQKLLKSIMLGIWGLKIKMFGH